MNTTPTNGSGPEQVELLDLAIVLLKRKRLIAGLTLAGCALSLAVALLLPPIYRAETKILPPQQGGSKVASQMINQIVGETGLATSLLGTKTPDELYVEMLRSRTVADRIIDRFDLMKVYDEKYREDMRERLFSSGTFSSGLVEVDNDRKSGLISLSVEDKDPKRAAAIANAFVEEMKALSGGLAITEASQRRLFYEDQLKAIRQALGKAEDEVRSFQEKTGALQIDEQAKAMIEGIAALRAQIASREVQLKVLRTYATGQNPDLRLLEEELNALKSELSKLEGKHSKGADVLMPTGLMPEVGRDYLRKLRNMKYQETLFALLSKQYEMARLDEANEAVVIQIVDVAIPPGKKFRPKRFRVVAVSTFASFLASVLFVLFSELYLRASRDPSLRDKIADLKTHLRLG